MVSYIIYIQDQRVIMECMNSMRPSYKYYAYKYYMHLMIIRRKMIRRKNLISITFDDNCIIQSFPGMDMSYSSSWMKEDFGDIDGNIILVQRSVLIL